MSADFLSPPMGLKPRSDSLLTINHHNHQSRHLKFRLLPVALLAAIIISGSLPFPALASEDSTSAASPGGATPAELSKVIIAGDTQTEIAPTAAIAAAALAEVPGGTTVITAKDFQKARVATAADALAFQPGVLAQSSGGQDALKISIRGSGINRGTGFFRDGVYFEFDGLPITGPGGTPFELLEPLGVNYIEILRGANAFETGALTLGGTVNYISNTGYDAPGTLIRLEAGSFGYYKGQLSFGGVNDKFDYYASITDSYRRGFQTHSDSRAHGFEGNLGCQVNPNIETRLYLRYRYTFFDNPGLLTKAQLDANPSQGSPLPTGNVKFNSFRLQPGSTWVGDKTTVKIDPDSKLELDFVFHDYPIAIGTTGSPFTGSATSPVFNSNINPAYNPAFLSTSAYNGGTLANWWFDDVSAKVKYTRSDELFGRESNSIVELRDTTHVNAGVSTLVNYGGSPYFGQIFRDRNFNGSSDAVLLAKNDLEIFRKLWLTIGLAGTYTQRVDNITLPVVNHFDQKNWNDLEELGLRYEVSPDVQVFSNFGRTVEPANAWAYLAPTNANSLPLKEQTAETVEIGARAKAGIFDGSLSYYYSSVHNELQALLINPSNPSLGTVEENASPTIHQGIEAELDTVLWQEGADNAGADGAPNRITLHQAYTFSDFYFRNDPVFGHNKEAGLPKNYYQAELLYEHPSGLYVGVNAQASSGYFVDYADTFSIDQYVIYGAKIGYAPPKKGWQAYLDFQNLTNKAYAASITPTYDVHGADTAVINSGDGFGVFGGVSFHF
jgi:iron complex outermembrane receptor protein